MAKITTIPLFRSAFNAGSGATSGPIDLRYISTMQRYSLHYTITGGTSATAGTTVFSYIAAALEDGPYGDPKLHGTFGTSGTGKSETKTMDLRGDAGTGQIVLSPWIKIIAMQTGAGNAGAQSIVTATLNVQ